MILNIEIFCLKRVPTVRRIRGSKINIYYIDNIPIKCIRISSSLMFKSLQCYFFFNLFERDFMINDFLNWINTIVNMLLILRKYFQLRTDKIYYIIILYSEFSKKLVVMSPLFYYRYSSFSVQWSLHNLIKNNLNLNGLQ